MNAKPQVTHLPDGGSFWTAELELLTVCVYVPHTELPDDLLNFGYEAPYLLVFEDHPRTAREAADFAAASGLGGIAAAAAGSVVFVSPRCEGGWRDAQDSLYQELIAHTKIHQYHEHGYAILHNRLTGSNDGYAIRGAIYRAFVYGKGDAADYIATRLLKAMEGAGLWGPADIVPTACILEGLSVSP